MRRIIHRLLTSFPPFGIALAGLLAASNPAGAKVRVDGFIELMSDGRFFWLCLAVLLGYFILWWITSLEPVSHRKRLQNGLRRHFEELSKAIDEVRTAKTDADFESKRDCLQITLQSAADWIEQNMGTPAFEKFKSPDWSSSSWSWPGEHDPETVKIRNEVITLSRARRDVIDTFLRYDGWDGAEPSFGATVLKRISQWKTRK